MNFGPLELAAYLDRRDAGRDESARVRAARAAVPPSSAANRLTIVFGPREMRRVPRDPAAVPVHVYEAIAHRTGAPRDQEVLRITVRSPHFVVLVLTSHQPSVWQIECLAATQLAAVLIAGCGQCEVRGAGAAPVSTLGGLYAFRRGSGDFRHLEDHVRRLTGQGIARFRSASAESAFDAWFD